MGLGDVGNFDPDSQNSNSSSSGGSSSGGGSDTRTRQPYLLVNHYEEDDEWEVRRYPDSPQLEVERKNGSTKLANPFRHHKKIIWTESQYKVLRRNIQEEYGVSLKEALLQDPEQAMVYIRNVANHRNAEAPNLEPECAICGKEFAKLGGDWRDLNNRIVCETHTVQELREHGII